MSTQSIPMRALSKMRKVPCALRRRLNYQWRPKALRWKYLQRHSPDRPLITALDGCLKVRIYPTDVIGRQIYIDGVFERECWTFVETFLQPGMTFFDLGANLGQYTLLAARCVGATGSVHSFEPSSRMFEELRFNVSLNEMGDICTLNRVAVSNEAGVATLSRYQPGYEVFGSLGASQRDKDHCLGSEQVSTIRLDDYLPEHGLKQVHFMKIDIEGAELRALQGAEALLSQAGGPAILIELADINTCCFGYTAVEIWDYLVDLGYAMYALRRGGRRLEPCARPSDFERAMNAVAMKPEIWNACKGRFSC